METKCTLAKNKLKLTNKKISNKLQILLKKLQEKVKKHKNTNKKQFKNTIKKLRLFINKTYTKKLKMNA